MTIIHEKSSGCRLHRNPATEKCKVMVMGRWKGTLQQEDIPLPYLKLTDHLDYLGCKLYATYSATRKENGDILKKKVKDQLAGWKAGKFLPLTSRPWSLNTYCLSKLWYKTGCIDLRIGDSNTITSSVKGWLYQDLLQKPQEMMAYRQVELGGLGLHNVKMRAMAMLIHTFLAQAISPRFNTNYFLNALFKWHVLDDRDILDPGRPPYYSVDFFSIIKDVHTNTPLNVIWVTVKQWYRLLLERGVTHNSVDTESPPLLIPSRTETNHPLVEFATPYRLARLFGLCPEQKTFLFKMLQSLLPTRVRLHRFGKAPSPDCIHCLNQADTMEHIFTCTYNTEVMTPLMHCLRNYLDAISFEDLITLNISTTESLELPVVWLLSTCLMLVWDKKLAVKKPSWETIRAEIVARVAILKHTKWKHYSLHNSATLLDEMLNLHLH